VRRRREAARVPGAVKRRSGLSESHETSRGGEHLLIRPVRPEDSALYPAFLREVNADDLRLRFFGRVAELTAEEGRKLAHVDHKRETALVALDENTGEMLGLVRLRDELDEETGEFAILVRSRLKGHGVGWLLMRRVIDYAKAKRLRRVYGDVLVENAAMLQMCGELGFRELDMGPEFRRVVLEL
jgi:acetyltransferase